jgi:hypothetical protein
MESAGCVDEKGEGISLPSRFGFQEEHASRDRCGSHTSDPIGFYKTKPKHKEDRVKSRSWYLRFEEELPGHPLQEWFAI